MIQDGVPVGSMGFLAQDVHERRQVAAVGDFVRGVRRHADAGTPSVLAAAFCQTGCAAAVAAHTGEEPDAPQDAAGVSGAARAAGLGAALAELLVGDGGAELLEGAAGRRIVEGVPGQPGIGEGRLPRCCGSNG